MLVNSSGSNQSCISLLAFSSESETWTTFSKTWVFEFILPYFPLIEINFLCIHPKLRHKNLAPLMIKEISRRISLYQIWQAFYTGDNNLPNS
jgi:hypothetical protein